MRERGRHRTARQRFENLERVAVEVELETSRHEETLAEAERHVLVRVGRVVLGVVVLVAGLIMLPLPGPGLLTVAAGLALLASDVPYARRLLDRVRRRLPADADGKVPRRIVFTGSVVSAVTIGFSVWWTLLR
jgi:uncharacterized protein (TIGR02611 family)